MDFPNDSLDRERIVSAAPLDDDASFELKLRPQRLREFIGQDKVKNNLEIAIQAAKSRGEALDHVLLYGPPGLGKTTLANIIANELGAAFQQTSGPTLQIKGDLTAILTNLREKQVLFIDEVHRMQPALEELLQMCESFGIGHAVKIDLSMIRGLSYYTGTVWELFDTSGSLPRAIAGGGRYDKLIEHFGGKPTPMAEPVDCLRLRRALARRDCYANQQDQQDDECCY